MASSSARRSRGLPRDLSPELRALYEHARDDALASLEELEAEYADELSLGEGWITPEELQRVDWDRMPDDEEHSYRELFGPTFFAQLARIGALAPERSLRIVFWFTC